MDNKRPKLVEDAEAWCSIDKSFISSRLGTALLWFVVIFIIMIVVLYITQPSIIKKKNDDGTTKDEVDFIKIFIAATIVGVIIGIIGYIIKGRCSC